MDTPRGKRAKAMDTGDTISSLPDELRRRVLSLLPAKDAVRTCVLSPRWRNLWASAARLNVNAEGFTCQSSFISFVNALLLSRGSIPLKSFWLDLDADGTDIFLDNFHDTACLWICHALRSNIEELGIIYPRRNHEELQLEHCPFTSSYLKKLHLRNIEINNHAMKKLFSGCPALEDLEMINCEMFATEFSSATLKSLRFDHGFFREDIVINMPSLVSLHVEEFSGGGLSLVDVQSLITVSIDQCNATFAGACKILGALSHVKKLELLFPLMEVEGEHLFGSDMQLCQVAFANLTSLSLGDWCLHDNCKPLLHLLQHSPNLKGVTLKMHMWELGLHEYIDSSCSAAAADLAAPFKCENLRKVEINIWPECRKTVGLLVTILLTKLMSPPEISIKPF